MTFCCRDSRPTKFWAVWLGLANNVTTSPTQPYYPVCSVGKNEIKSFRRNNTNVSLLFSCSFLLFNFLFLICLYLYLSLILLLGTILPRSELFYMYVNFRRKSVIMMMAVLGVVLPSWWGIECKKWSFCLKFFLCCTIISIREKLSKMRWKV